MTNGIIFQSGLADELFHVTVDLGLNLTNTLTTETVLLAQFLERCGIDREFSFGEDMTFALTQAFQGTREGGRAGSSGP